MSGMINIKELKPYENNARIHTQEQLEMICNSLKEFGFINPIIIDENNIILAGHGRVEAAKLIGINEVPYRRINHLNESQKKAYVLADNKLFDLGKWDYDLLHSEVESLDIDMTKLGYEEFLKADFIVEDDNNNIDDNKELNINDYNDEAFKYKCPNCSFTFNEGK